MFFRDGQPVYASEEAKSYQHLDNLLGSYFHQDFDIFGTNLEEILNTYRNDSTEEDRRATVNDISRFLKAFGDTDARLAAELERTFKPEVIVEGWDGLTTRQWLQEVARIIGQ